MNEAMPDALTCPCCGFMTIFDECDICPICRWQHDHYQMDHPDDTDGPNRVSLRESQRNFARLGRGGDPPTVGGRRPTARDRRDPAWAPLEAD